MRLPVEAIATLKAKCDVRPGNIYPAQGGRKPGTDYWLVVAVSENAAHLVGFNAEGTPVSTASYLKHALRDRPVLGRAGIPDLVVEL